MKRMWSKKEIKKFADERTKALVEGGTLEIDAKSVTANNIVEKMSGYSFEENLPTNATLTHIYAGIVKTGNKLTLVSFLKINRNGTIANGFYCAGIFKLPADVMTKLVPYNFDSQDILNVSSVSHFVTLSATGKVDLVCHVNKRTTDVIVYVQGANNLTANTDYLARIEMTFLLSDNLIPEP